MRLPIITIACLLVLSGVAHAKGTQGVYVGAGAGEITIAGVGGNAAGYKVFIGDNFDKYFGIEGAYIDAGNESLGLYDPYSGVSAYGTESTRAAQLSLLGRIPLSQYFALFGRVDGIYWRDDTSVTAYDNYGDEGGYSISSTGTAFGWGAGGEASFGHFALRAEFEQSSINSYTYRLISGSLIYRF